MSSSSNPVATYNIFRTFYPPDKTATIRGGYFLMFAHSGVDKKRHPAATAAWSISGQPPMGSGSVEATRTRKMRISRNRPQWFYSANGFRVARTKK